MYCHLLHASPVSACNISRSPVTSLRAGKGFGVGKLQDAPSTSKGKRTAPTRDPSVRPISEDEAKQGRLDVVTVKDWGSGEQQDLGQLKVVRHSTPYLDDGTQPYHERLARELQAAQVSGKLQLASDGRAAPPPPFERWSFSHARYCQYLAEMHHLHSAMEQAVWTVCKCVDPAGGNSAAAVAPGDPSSSSSVDVHMAGLQALQALAKGFSPGVGLTRSAEISADLEVLLDRSTQFQSQAAPSTSTSASATTNGSSKEGSNHSAPPSQDPQQPLEASQEIRAYGEQLTRLAQGASDASTSAAERSSCASKLFAHAYVIYTSTFALGSRMGARACDTLQLPLHGADRLYRDFPGHVNNPIAVLQGAVDAAARALSNDDKKVMEAELPAAARKTSLLLVALAHID